MHALSTWSPATSHGTLVAIGCRPVVGVRWRTPTTGPDDGAAHPPLARFLVDHRWRQSAVPRMGAGLPRRPSSKGRSAVPIFRYCRSYRTTACADRVLAVLITDSPVVGSGLDLSNPSQADSGSHAVVELPCC